jgi:hypothetical protein
MYVPNDTDHYDVFVNTVTNAWNRLENGYFLAATCERSNRDVTSCTLILQRHKPDFRLTIIYNARLVAINGGEFDQSRENRFFFYGRLRFTELIHSNETVLI